MDPFGTHKDILDYYVKISSGDILELGTGNTSTSIVKKYINETPSRKLVSVDNDEDWLNKMLIDHPPSANHNYILVHDWDYVLNELSTRKWGVVFIDQKPWEARTASLQTFKNTADYIIIHDVDYFPKNNIFGKVLNQFEFDFSDQFKDWKLYYPRGKWPSPTGPPTLVGTNLGHPIYKGIL